MKNYGEYSTNFCGKISIKGETLSQNYISNRQFIAISDHVKQEDYWTLDLFAK